MASSASSSESETHFDVLVLSTDLAASIAAAALARAGLRVLHVDENEFYGGAHASLAPDELLRHPACTSTSTSQGLPPYARQYAIALAPAVINATGPLITSIVASGVSRYGGYKLLDALALAPPLRAVPGSKEDVFRSKELTLPEKHHLMKFLLFAAGEEPLADDDDEARRPFGAFLRERFKLGDRTADAVVYAIAQCSSAQEAAGSALARTRAFIRSSGRYGNSPFLLPYYGGLGEIAQGFCRTCAVHGGVYILGRKLLDLSRSSAPSPCQPQTQPESQSQPESQTQSDAKGIPEGDADERDAGKIWSITLDGVPDTLTASVLLASRPPPPQSPPHRERLTCRVALTDHPLALPDVDDALVVFPPSSSPSSSPNQNENEKENEPVVRALITGPKSMSAPPGHWVVHVFATSPSSTSESTPAPDLQPHLDTLLGGHAPIFTASFTLPAPSSSSAPAPSSSSSTTQPTSSSSTLPVSSSSESPDVLLDALPLGAPAELGDAAAVAAQKAFWAVVQRLGKQDEVMDFWPEVDPEEKDEGEREDEADW